MWSSDLFSVRRGRSRRLNLQIESSVNSNSTCLPLYKLHPITNRVLAQWRCSFARCREVRVRVPPPRLSFSELPRGAGPPVIHPGRHLTLHPPRQYLRGNCPHASVIQGRSTPGQMWIRPQIWIRKLAHKPLAFYRKVPEIQMPLTNSFELQF